MAKNYYFLKLDIDLKKNKFKIHFEEWELGEREVFNNYNLIRSPEMSNSVSTTSQSQMSPEISTRNAPPGFIRSSDLARLLGIKTATLSKWATGPMFPAPINLGGKILFYKVSEVQDFLASQGMDLTVLNSL